MTNGNKIRSMTNEELTAVLVCPYEFTATGAFSRRSRTVPIASVCGWKARQSNGRS